MPRSGERSVRVWQVLEGRLQDDAAVPRDSLTVDPGRLLTGSLEVRIDRDPRASDLQLRAMGVGGPLARRARNGCVLVLPTVR